MHPQKQAESPRRTAGLISQLFFVWLLPLFQKGFRKTLELEDLYRVLPEDESKALGDKLELAWNEELKKLETSKRKAAESGSLKVKVYQPSLTKALIKVYGASFSSYGIYAFYEECILKIAQPICLGFLLNYFKFRDDYEPYVGFLFGGAVILLSIIYTSSDHPFTFAVQHMGMKVRISLCCLLYRKTLRMSKKALEERTAAQIVNFLSGDMNRFDVCLTFLHYIWVAPLQLGIVIFVLFIYLDIGWPCLAGISLLVFFVPFQGFMGRVFSKLRLETAGKTDARLILMEEILGAMRVIKMYAWEEMFEDAVTSARWAEVKALRRTAYCKAVNQSLFYVTSRIVLFLTLLTFVLRGNVLTSQIVFVSLALYQSVQSVMTLFFPAGVTSTAEALVAVRRFQEFLLLDEYERRDDKYLEGMIKYPGGQGQSDVKFLKPPVVTQSKKSIIGKSNSSNSSSVLPVSVFGNFPSRFGIHAKNVVAQWNPDSRDMAFNSVSFDIKEGEILAVIGPVGAGKGSLLQAILGELEIKSGELEVKGRIGYVSQEPWIFPGTVRQNILFGKEFESEWYEDVIEACALTKDLHLLPYGDHTVVGERGTALSGGQKARINLARAVYADVEIYLLDDPLSAVDTEVSRHLVDKCICGLLKKKVRVLVTHQLQYLSQMSEVLLLIDGWMTFRGSYQNLILSGIPFTGILTRKFPIDSRQSINSQPTTTNNHKQLVGSSINLHPSQAESSCTLVMGTSGKAPMIPDHPIIYEKVTGGPSKGGGGAGTVQHVGPNNKGTPYVKLEPTGLVTDSSPLEAEEEVVGSGSISWRLYWAYLSAGSSCGGFISIILIAILTQILFTCTDFWLQFWIESEDTVINETNTEDMDIIDDIRGSRDYQISIYSGLILTLFLLCLIRSINFYRLCMKSSSKLHQRLFRAVIRSPMSFFENNPMGRILNRFAKDVAVLDESLPPVIFDTMEILLQTIGVVVIVSSTSAIMLIPAFLMAILFYFIRSFYFQTARAIKRLEGVARSPLFSHISTTLNGLTTIRAFGVEQIFQTEFEVKLDVHSSVWYSFLASTRWLGILVDWISILFVATVLLNFLCKSDDDEKGSDAVVGLAITSATMLTSMLQWGMRQSAELENQMISVERVMQYCDLKPEAQLESDHENQPPKNWPQKGEILIQNLSLKYSPESPTFVLKNINCSIKAGEKVGVVGRTGAGKSSILSVLFRLSEPWEGFIEIDGIVTSWIGLHDLRSRISIIPQEPVLFLGTIRKNLDPFSQFPDDLIWSVLKDVNLDEAVKDLPQGLYAKIAEGGSNFSVGQKQLFCLARAILQNNQILVLDEATANVDPETDALIQNTLRRNFVNCTVITIAHRLQTVMDSDRILVLDAGQIVEFEEPLKLLSDGKSRFSELVGQSGKGEAAQLLYIARMASERRRLKMEEEEDEEDEDEDL